MIELYLTASALIRKDGKDARIINISERGIVIGYPDFREEILAVSDFGQDSQVINLERVPYIKVKLQDNERGR